MGWFPFAVLFPEAYAPLVMRHLSVTTTTTTTF
jgi:hypothetical protein